MELLFLSFTTLSSTGLSDVVPILPHARSFVMIEQLAGLAYVAMIVSWMVGLTVARSRAGLGGADQADGDFAPHRSRPSHDVHSADIGADEVPDAVGDGEGHRAEQ